MREGQREVARPGEGRMEGGREGEDRVGGGGKAPGVLVKPQSQTASTCLVLFRVAKIIRVEATCAEVPVILTVTLFSVILGLRPGPAWEPVSLFKLLRVTVVSGLTQRPAESGSVGDSESQWHTVRQHLNLISVIGTSALRVHPGGAALTRTRWSLSCWSLRPDFDSDNDSVSRHS